MGSDGFFPIILTNLNKLWERKLPSGSSVTFAAKSIISGRNDNITNPCLYYITKGSIRLSNILSDGQEKILLYMGKGTIFNEIPMLQTGKDYIFTAVDSTEAIFWPRKKIDIDFIRSNPDLILNFLQSISYKTRIFYTKACEARGYSSFVNTCRALYSMHLYNRERGKVVPRLSQQELTAFLGVHRSSLHKALARLKKEGIIGKYNRQELPIINPAALYAYTKDFEKE